MSAGVFIFFVYFRMKKSSLIMYSVIVLISLCVIFFVWRNSEWLTLTSSPANWLSAFKKWMDIAWGVRLNYKIDLSTYEAVYTDPQEYAEVTRNIQNIILQNIDLRISALGVSDYTSYIQSLEDWQYLVIELWWVQNLDEAKDIIWKTVELEFKTLYEGDGSDIRGERLQVVEELLTDAVQNPWGFAAIVNGSLQNENVYYDSHRDVTLEDLPIVYQNNPELLEQREQEVYGTRVEWQYTTQTNWWTISKLNDVKQTTGSWWTQTVYSVEEIVIDAIPQWVLAQDPITNQILNWAFFKFASVSQGQTWEPVASITFDDTWKEIFCNLTAEIVWSPLAIFVWWELVTSPNINEKICGWSAQISWQFTLESSKKLVEDLNEWALPAALLLANEEKVSATLGEQALQWAMIAAVIGLSLVFVYMTISYGVQYGVISLIALLSFLIVLFAIIKLIWSALSLSGIAAILLSIGMGVDANILIYERIKEEEAEWTWPVQAIMLGYEKSWSAIKDWNVTTLMIALILFFIGTNVFKGFGTTMIINIWITLMILVPYTKELLLAMSNKN